MIGDVSFPELKRPKALSSLVCRSLDVSFPIVAAHRQPTALSPFIDFILPLLYTFELVNMLAYSTVTWKSVCCFIYPRVPGTYVQPVLYD